MSDWRFTATPQTRQDAQEANLHSSLSLPDMTSRQHFDVAIIGAGLAGSAAATLLADRGWRVALFERHRYPHDKVCGEFLSPETEPIFRRLAVWSELEALHPPRLTEVLITAPDGASFRARLPGGATGLSRLRLDPLLAARAVRAGADFRDGTPVISVAGSLDEGFALTLRSTDGREHTLRARAVLGAWGKRATLDRALARPFFRRHHPFLALKAHHVKVQTGPRVELHGFDGGYVGLAAIEDGRTNICLLATEAAFAAAGRTPDGLFKQMARQNPTIAGRLSGAERVGDLLAVSQIPFGPKSPVEHDILMLGDSAESISPLAGDGMAMALRSAELVAPLVHDFLETGDAGALMAGYSSAWTHEFRTRLRLGRLIQPLFLRPHLLSLGLRLVRLVPPLGTHLILATRGPGVRTSTV